MEDEVVEDGCMLQDQTIDDDIPDAVPSPSIRDSVVASERDSVVASERGAGRERGRSKGSRASPSQSKSAHESYSQHYEDDFDELYSADFDFETSVHQSRLLDTAPATGKASSSTLPAATAALRLPSPSAKSIAAEHLARSNAGGDTPLSEHMVDLTLMMPDLPLPMQVSCVSFFVNVCVYMLRYMHMQTSFQTYT